MASDASSRGVDKVGVLHQTDLFSNLPDEILRKAASVAITRHLTRDQVLFSENDEASGLFIVASGELRSIRQNLDGREQVLSTERIGSVLAAVPVFNGGKYYSTIIADAKSDVLCIEKQQFHQLCHDHTELLWNLARVLAHKVRHCAELIESLALRNVEQRVAQHLLTIAAERGVPVGPGCLVELRLTRAEIASRVGSAREVVSRAFTHLQEAALIQMKGRRLVTVPDMQKLRAFAGAETSRKKPAMLSELSSEMA